MQHGEISYAIEYLNADGTKRGRELCLVTTHKNGQRTIRAKSEIFDSEILRDVVYTVNNEFRPIDCYVRVRQYEEVIGSAWFNFEETESRCVGVTKDQGHISQSFQTTKRPDSFISHAVSTDVWHCANIKPDESLGSQIIDPVPSCSPLPNGASGPTLGIWTMRAKYIGIETVTVPAGDFKAEHVQYLKENGSLALEMWCTNDSDRIMLKMHFPIYNSNYLLSQLTRE